VLQWADGKAHAHGDTSRYRDELFPAPWLGFGERANCYANCEAAL
jgi:hypothetical protein